MGKRECIQILASVCAWVHYGHLEVYKSNVFVSVSAWAYIRGIGGVCGGKLCLHFVCTCYSVCILSDQL